MKNSAHCPYSYHFVITLTYENFKNQTVSPHLGPWLSSSLAIHLPYEASLFNWQPLATWDYQALEMWLVQCKMCSTCKIYAGFQRHSIKNVKYLNKFLLSCENKRKIILKTSKELFKMKSGNYQEAGLTTQFQQLSKRVNLPWLLSSGIQNNYTVPSNLRYISRGYWIFSLIIHILFFISY